MAMGEQDKQDRPAGGGEPIAIPGSAPHGHRRAYAKLLGLAAALVVISLAVVVGAVLLSHSRDKDTEDTRKPATTAKVTPAQQAQKQAYEGDISAAEQTLLAELKHAQNKQDQAVIYDQLASIMLNADQNDKALSYAQTADKLNPSASNAYLLAKVELALGDKTTVKTYLQTAINRLDKNALGYGTKLEQYQAELNAVGT